jgi:hypothetical protein
VLSLEPPTMAQRPLSTVTDSTHLYAAPIVSVADALV